MQTEIGKQYTRLTVIEHYSTDEDSHKHYICRCSCSEFTLVREDHLRSGHTSSCGCLRGHNNRKSYVQSN